MNLGDTATKVSAITAAIVSFGALIAVIGGEVLFVRLHHAQLPDADVVYDFPRLRLITLGLVELVYTGLVLAVLTGLVWVLDKIAYWGTTKRGGSPARACWTGLGLLLLAPAVFAPRNTAGIIEAAIVVAVLVCLIVILGGPVPATERGNKEMKRRRIYLLAAAGAVASVILAVIFAVLSGTSEAITASVVLAVAAVVLLWTAAGVTQPHNTDIPHLLLWAIVIAVAVAFTVLRQTSFPGGFPEGSVALKAPEPEKANINETPPPVGSSGLYVGKTDSQVFIATALPTSDSGNGSRKLLIYPTDSVTQIVAGPIDPDTVPDVPDSVIGTSFACLLPACSDGGEGLPVISPPVP